jgi:hypothetical protein
MSSLINSKLIKIVNGHSTKSQQNNYFRIKNLKVQIRPQTNIKYKANICSINKLKQLINNRSLRQRMHKQSNFNALKLNLKELNYHLQN